MNWTPQGVEKVNSVYGLALHIASSQVAIAAMSAGVEAKLDIPELEEGNYPLKAVGSSADRALELLRKAAEMTNEIFEQVSAEQLEAEITMPGGTKRSARFGFMLLISHAAEHVGHMSLTKQLYVNQKSN